MGTGLKPEQSDDTAHRELTAMVYGGDIYAVLVRDRAVRRMTRTDYPSKYRRDAGWPFIR